MSEDRYKQALGNLDSDMRTCIKYLERQIKESKVAPLKALQELEKNVSKTLARMEQRDKLWVKSMETIGKLEDEYMEQTPNFLEQMHKEYCQELENIGKQYLKEFNQALKRFDKYIKKLDSLEEGIRELLLKEEKTKQRIKIRTSLLRTR